MSTRKVYTEEFKRDAIRLADLKAVLPKRFVVTTDSDHALPIAENLLDREFEARHRIDAGRRI